MTQGVSREYTPFAEDNFVAFHTHALLKLKRLRTHAHPRKRDSSVARLHFAGTSAPPADEKLQGAFDQRWLW